MTARTIFHASDLHFGAEDRVALDWFAQCVADERPDAAIITGDLTMRARHREFAAAAAWLSALPAPVTVEIGNHDMPYFNPIERFATPYRRYLAMEAMVETPIALPGIAIIPLRTTAPAQWRLNWSKGIVTPQALAETMAHITATKQAADQAGGPAPLILISAHHPLVETGTRGTAWTKGGTAALDALSGAGVAAVLSGHVHDPFDMAHQAQSGAVRMIGAGTLSERVRTTPPSFNVLTIADGAIALSVRMMP